MRDRTVPRPVCDAVRSAAAARRAARLSPALNSRPFYVSPGSPAPARRESGAGCTSAAAPSRRGRLAAHLLSDHALRAAPPVPISSTRFASTRPKRSTSRRNQAGPPGLVARAEARPVVPVEVLVEEDQVAPVRVVLELRRAAVHRALGRRSSRRNVPASRRVISSATSKRFIWWPDPVGHSTVKSSP